MISLDEYRDNYPKDKSIPWNEYIHSSRQEWIKQCLWQLIGELNESNHVTVLENLITLLIEDYNNA